MAKLSTDREILHCIYEMYAADFRANQKMPDDDVGNRIYLPIDVRAVASKLGDDPHVLFGRLYYHLAHEYGYKKDDGARVDLFAFKIADQMHCINYPYLAAILSDHLSQHTENTKAFWLSIAALIVSIVSALATVLPMLSE
ncbi:hypothetical protein CSC76_05925 [Pseudoxanthomonas mexicana]|uniref:hypothetical protein n=1 Tax=Pseudoxanthomonas mexicana TaxID=128785 RepID=UPI0013894159|nr:hypothetical protein [Pseudoxanthomonas mexicana]KAF1728302.1 hypothetical protein CSC76_05925 [Pseudoxanthomonas mexicana]